VYYCSSHRNAAHTVIGEWRFLQEPSLFDIFSRPRIKKEMGREISSGSFLKAILLCFAGLEGFNAGLTQSVHAWFTQSILHIWME
jgi:hypothetical protein